MGNNAEPVTILTWKWQQPNGRITYTSDHVNNLMRDIRDNITLPARFMCCTDDPVGIEPWIETRTLPEIPEFHNPHWDRNTGIPHCYYRLDVFRSDAEKDYGRRILNIDLDCLVLGNLDHILSRPEEFVALRSMTSKRPYNGSLWLLAAGSRPWVYDQFEPELAVHASSIYEGSDQAWISYALGWTEAVFTKSHDGVMFYKRSMAHLQGETRGCCLFFFAGRIKLWDRRLSQDPFIKSHLSRHKFAL